VSVIFLDTLYPEAFFTEKAAVALYKAVGCQEVNVDEADYKNLATPEPDRANGSPWYLTLNASCICDPLVVWQSIEQSDHTTS